MNTIGNNLRLTTFGESHGPAIGGIIDGCPPGIKLDLLYIQELLDRRKPGQSSISSLRNEPDEVEFLSGFFEGYTIGTPIGFIIRNTDVDSSKYSKDFIRKGHADATYKSKYGHYDYRGGGRSSARETACRIVAGGIAEMILNQLNVGSLTIAHTYCIAEYKAFGYDLLRDKDNIYTNPMRCASIHASELMLEYVEKIKAQYDSIGGVIECKIFNPPKNLGDPIYGKFSSELVKALFTIPAVRGVDIGNGFNSANLLGSQNNEYPDGILGGITTGETIEIRVAFKPTASIGNIGRHDPCVVPRAVPVVKAMVDFVLTDLYLENKKYSNDNTE